MNHTGSVLIVEKDPSSLGFISDTFEMMDFEAARAIELKRISKEYQGLCKGFVWGGHHFDFYMGRPGRDSSQSLGTLI
jgi:hypothetical protein